jgi:hypothetical protein
LIARPDGPAQQFRVAFVEEIDYADLLPKARNVLDWQIEEIGSESLGADDPPAFVHAIFEQLKESIARLVSRRLRSEDHQIPDVRVGNDITNELFDADVFSLDGA